MYNKNQPVYNTHGNYKNILLAKYGAQKVDVKDEVIRLVMFMFTTKAMVIIISKMVHFMYILLNTAKNQSQSGQDISMHLKGVI